MEIYFGAPDLENKTKVKLMVCHIRHYLTLKVLGGVDAQEDIKVRAHAGEIPLI